MSTGGNITNVGARRGWITILLCVGALLLLLGARPAHAQSTTCVGTYGGLLDGNFTPVPSNLQIDGPCTIKNYPASNPYGGNISLLSTRNTLLIFDNVDFTGNISCDKVHQNVVWFVNGSITRQHVLGCTNNEFIFVEKIDKQNPPGPPFVSIGVPFTYTLTFPQTYDPLTGRVTDPNGSANDISQVSITDDLNATGVSLSYVSSTATWKASGASVPYSVTNNGGLLTFSGFPTVPAHQQIVLTVTVVLNNVVPPNSPGTSFINTANWQLGRLINGVFTYPLPGQQGVTSPLTIVAPKLIMTKGGPVSMSQGQPGAFSLNLQNTGTSDVWNATIQDRLPTGATGGMCAAPPKILTAQVFQADGVTPVPGKGPLIAGTDYTIGFSGAPTCTLTLNLLTAAAVIGPTQRLIVTYQAQLDPNTQFGVTLTNVAGVTQWYNAPAGNPGRQVTTCPLTDGTPGVADCQDAHTVTVAAGTSAVVMTKGGPATMSLGQPASFSLNLQNTGTADVWNATIADRLPYGATGGMCAAPPKILTAQVFQADGVTPVPGKGPLVAVTDYTITFAGAPTCTLTLNLLTAAAAIGPTERLIITYQVQLDPNTQLGATLTNVAGATQWYNAPSGSPGRLTITCPLTNGTPGVADCQDAHTVTVAATTSAVVMTKGGPAAMSLGQPKAFSLNLQNTGSADVWNATIEDRLPYGATGGMCVTPPKILTAQVFQADGVTPVPGKGPLIAGTDYTISFAGAPTCTLTLNLLTAAAVIGPTQRLIITYQVQLDPNTQIGATLTNVAGATQWYNAPSGSPGRQTITCPLTNGTPGVADCQDAHTVTVVAASSGVVMTKGGPATMSLGQPGTFSLNLQNTGTSDVWNATIQDRLPYGATGGTCATPPKILTAQVFQADGVTPVPGKGPLIAGTDYTIGFSGAPTCTLTLNLLTAAAAIGPTERLIITYQARLDPNTQNGITLTNVAGATDWYNAPSGSPGRLAITCPLTNGTPGVADCQDAHTVTVTVSALTLTKQVTVVGGGAALPGATLDYLVHVTNTSAIPATPVVITDDLNAAGPGVLTYVNGTATMNGSPAGVTVSGNVITASYSATYGPLAPGGTVDVRFRATLGATLSFGTIVTNTGIVTWGNPPQSVSGSASIVVSAPPGALAVSKTTPLVDVTRGQLVPYTITVTEVLAGPLPGAALVDRFPAGFRYVPGSARLDGVPTEPTLAGLTLTWSNLSFTAGGHHTILLLLAVGAGVGEGEFVNRAQAFAGVNGPPISNEGTAKVRVVPDQTFDCTDVIGKVFDDANGNGRQDPGEKGLPGVRVLTTRGLAAITDQYGRFHITCAITPLEGRGSNFALKLDERTLPSGYRPTTPEVLVERATRGKALRFEFGASIHRVVSLDLSDAAFEPGTAELRPQWQGGIDRLLEELRKSRSVLHLSYLADVEEPLLVEKRLEAVAESIRAAWQASKCCYELSIEREIFWLRGSPPKEPVERLRGAQ